MNRPWFHVIACALLVASMAGCGPAGPTTRPSTPGFTATAVSATPTGPLCTPPASLLPATCVLPSPTRQPQPSKTPVPPTPSPMPTLPPVVEQQLLLGLLESNAGCRLPCWWGFTPGVTLGQTARDFFQALGVWLRVGEGENFGAALKARERGTVASQSFHVQDDIIEMIRVYTADLLYDPRSVERDPYFQQDMHNYLLPQMLAVYGPPAQVLFSANVYMPERVYHLLLFYPDQGILVFYTGVMDRGEEVIRLCPQQVIEILLWLWSPGRDLALEDFAPELGLDDGIIDYRPLEAATDWTIESFYRAFRAGGGQECLETPTHLWP